MTEATIVASCVSLVLGFVLNGIMAHVFGGVPDMKKRLNALETERVSKVEDAVQKINDRCRAHQEKGDLKVLIAGMSAMKESLEEVKRNSKDLHVEFKQMVQRVEDVAASASEKAATAMARVDGHSRWMSDHDRDKHGGR